MAKQKISSNLQLAYLILFFVMLIIITLATSNSTTSFFTRADAPKSSTQKQGWLDFMNAVIAKPTPTDVPAKEPTKPIKPTSKPSEPEPEKPTTAPVQAGPACPVDKKGSPGCVCNKPDWVSYRCPFPEYGTLQMIGIDKKVWVHQQLDPAAYAKAEKDPSCDRWCVGKPVIYLYPTETMPVHVDVSVPGRIFISDPQYPVGGWDVIADPDGQLDYLGKTYKELYFESDLDTAVKAPQTGIVIARSQLRSELERLTTKLGLIEHERVEFVDYWLPKLEALHQPYILFGIVDPVEKKRIDNVAYNPQPDTIIEFIVYFKALQYPIVVEPLELPKQPPQRAGFTAVEWGGVIAP